MKAKIEDFVGIYEDCCSVEWCNRVIENYEKAKSQGFFLIRQQYDDNDKTRKDDECFWSGMTYQRDISDASSEIPLDALEDHVGVETNRILWNNCYPHYADAFSPLKMADTHKNWTNKLQKTEVGQGYHVWHFEQSSRGQSGRLMAYILYLNDVEEGGETEFLYIHKRVKPKAGTMVIFPASYTHTHRGNPPLSNEKYIITGWIEM